jgi:hypothetical protein
MMFSNKTNSIGGVFKTHSLGVMDQGFGRLYLPPHMDLFLKDRVLVGVFEQKTYNVTALEDGEISITLSWLDPPSIPFAGKKDLINDFNLRVIKGGIILLGNDQEDSLNNLERVKVFVKKGENLLINISPKGPITPFRGVEPRISLILVGKVEEHIQIPECLTTFPPLQCPISGEIGGKGCINNKWGPCHGMCTQKNLFWVKEECKCLQDAPCIGGVFTRKCLNGIYPAPCPEKITPQKIKPPPRRLHQIIPDVWVTWVEILSISIFLVGLGCLKKIKR